ncbi:MAG: hypothetical protein ACLTE2_11615 [Eubacteriales bacterium]
MITKEDFQEKIWKLPVESMLGVGRATLKKLHESGVFTIGNWRKAMKIIFMPCLVKTEVSFGKMPMAETNLPYLMRRSRNSPKV